MGDRGLSLRDRGDAAVAEDRRDLDVATPNSSRPRALHERRALLRELPTGMCLVPQTRCAVVHIVHSLLRVKRVAEHARSIASCWLTEGNGGSVHSLGDVGGGHVEVFRTSIHAASDMREGWLQRARAQADCKVLQHQVLLHRSRAPRALAQPGAQDVVAPDTDAATASVRLPGVGLRPRSTAPSVVSGTRRRSLGHVPPHRLNVHAGRRGSDCRLTA